MSRSDPTVAQWSLLACFPLRGLPFMLCAISRLSAKFALLGAVAGSSFPKTMCLAFVSHGSSLARIDNTEQKHQFAYVYYVA